MTAEVIEVTVLTATLMCPVSGDFSFVTRCIIKLEVAISNLYEEKINLVSNDTHTHNGSQTVII